MDQRKKLTEEHAREAGAVVRGDEADAAVQRVLLRPASAVMALGVILGEPMRNIAVAIGLFVISGTASAQVGTTITLWSKAPIVCHSPATLADLLAVMRGGVRDSIDKMVSSVILSRECALLQNGAELIVLDEALDAMMVRARLMPDGPDYYVNVVDAYGSEGALERFKALEAARNEGLKK